MSEKELKGLIFKLRKRRNTMNADWERDIEAKDETLYYVLGYYDYLTIESVYGWNGFFPDYRIKNGNNNILPCYSEEFQLKMIHPRSDDAYNGSERFFSYIQGAAREDTRKGFPGADGKNEPAGPFIIMVMLHFSELALKIAAGFKSGGNSLYEPLNLNKYLQTSIIRDIIGSGKMTEAGFRALNCATYYTTGFCDMIAVFRTSAIGAASGFISELRSLPVCMGNESGFLLSDTSDVCGIDCGYNPKLFNMNRLDPNFGLSVRFLLKPGISVDMFSRNIRSALAVRHPDPKELDAILPPENLYQMYGNSDIMLRVDRPWAFLSEYVRMDAQKPGIFTLDSEFYKANIISIKTNLRWNKYSVATGDYAMQTGYITVNNDKLDKLSEDAKALINNIIGRDGALNAWMEARKLYAPAIGVSFNHSNIMRIADDLKHTLELYCDFSCQDHAFDIRSMINPILQMFEKKLYEIVSFLKDAFNNNRSDILDNIMLSDSGIEQLHHELKELFLDLLRSERQYVEEHAMLHPSIATASKLIFAYNTILRYLGELSRWEDVNFSTDSSQAFFITSKGVANTTGDMYFSFLPPNRINDQGITESLLLQMRLPECTLFNIGPALYFLSHESWHYLGYRNHNLRARMYQRMVYRYMAAYMGMMYLGYKPVIEKALDGIKDAALKDGLIATGMDFLNKKRLEYQEKQNTDFDQISDTDTLSFGTLISQNLATTVKKKICEQIAPRYYETRKDSYAIGFDELLGQDLADMFVEIRRKLLETAPDSSKLAAWPLGLDFREQIHRFPKDEISLSVQLHIDNFLGNRYYIGENVKKQYEIMEPDIDDRVWDCLTVNAGEASIELMSVFKEVFAEITTILYLGCEPGQYLSIFLFENETPEQIFQANALEAILRFGCVLTLIDTQVRNLMEEQDSRAFMAGNSAVVGKYKEDILNSSVYVLYNTDGDENVQKTVDRFFDSLTNALFSFWRAFYQTGVAAPLMDYGRWCMDYHKDRIARIKKDSLVYGGFLECLQELFQESMAKTGYPENMSSMWDKLFLFWSLPAQEGVGENWG